MRISDWSSDVCSSDLASPIGSIMLSKRSSWPSQRAPASPAQSCAASASLFPPELFIIALPVSYQSKSAHDAEGGERPLAMAGHEPSAEAGALDTTTPPPPTFYPATR